MKQLLILLLFLPITTFSQIRDLVGDSGGIYSYYQIRELIDGCIDNTLIETIKFNGDNELELLKLGNLQELCGCYIYIYIPYNTGGWYYYGETNERECNGSFRGATYTTPQFRIHEDRILSCNGDIQIWRSTKGVYQYLKIK
jgi:hypothetical protein